MRTWFVGAVGIFSIAIASPAAALSQDYTGLSHDIYAALDANGDPVLFDGNPTFYELGGQSAFIQTRVGGSTSGGQLDGATGFGIINFVEVFPPALLTDYLTYSYLGVVSLRGTDVNNDPVLLDQSIVIAYRPSVAEGQRIEDLFPGSGYTESALVTAFTTSFDSPEFLDMAFSRVGGQANTSGAIGVYETDCHFTSFCDPATQIQLGEDLDLIAFVGGLNGDEGVRIGQIGFGLTRANNLPVPEPTPQMLLAAGAIGLCLVRRRARRAN